MRCAHDSLRNSKDQSCQANEEYELDRIGALTYQLTAGQSPTSTSATTVEHKKTRGRRGSSKKITRPLHIHYIPIEAARDHLANERVFLAYIRTASALANFAVAILQLYRLKHSASPNKLSDYDLGIPLAAVTLFTAMAVTLAGAWRFFACQNAMVLRNQIITSGRVVLFFIPVLILVCVLTCRSTDLQLAKQGTSCSSHSSSLLSLSTRTSEPYDKVVAPPPVLRRILNQRPAAGHREFAWEFSSPNTDHPAIGGMDFQE